jgi:methyl-accepting chemotaxis protein
MSLARTSSPPGGAVALSGTADTAGWGVFSLTRAIRAMASALGWLLQRRPAKPASGVAARQITELDQLLYEQLRRAVALSEKQAMEGMLQTADLQDQSTQLLSYLAQARTQTEAMQHNMERNADIIQQLGDFVRRLPQQISQEREQFARLVADIKRLQDLAEMIRGMARQTEILSINAAIEAARAGTAGRGFAVLAGEVRRLATESNSTAHRIESDIERLVRTVETGYSNDLQARTQHNEAESERLANLTRDLDESYVDMRQFYQLLMMAVSQHNTRLDAGISRLLDTSQYQDICKQMVDRAEPTLQARQALVHELLDRLHTGEIEHRDLDERAGALITAHLASEAMHRDPEAKEPQAACASGVDFF